MSLADSLMQLRRTALEGNVGEMPSVVLLFPNRRDMEVFKCQVRNELRPMDVATVNAELDNFQLVGINVVIGVR